MGCHPAGQGRLRRQLGPQMLRILMKSLTFVEAVAATVSYGIVAVLLMVDVVGREVFGTAFLGLQQLSVYGAIIAGFLGLTLATSDNAHLRPGFLDFVSGPRLDPLFRRVGDLVSAGFFWAGAYICSGFVSVSMEMGDRAPVLYFLLWPLQLIIPYAFASAGLKHLLFALRPELKPQPAEPVH